MFWSCKPDCDYPPDPGCSFDPYEDTGQNLCDTVFEFYPHTYTGSYVSADGFFFKIHLRYEFDNSWSAYDYTQCMDATLGRIIPLYEAEYVPMHAQEIELLIEDDFRQNYADMNMHIRKVSFVEISLRKPV